MNPFTLAYTEILFRPLLNLLVGITNVLPGHGVGLAIIFVTLIVRLILLPISLRQIRHTQTNQTKMKAIQAQLAKIKEQHKNDKQKQAEATMAAYKEAGINPAAGCLPLLIQLPVLIALYRVFLTQLGPETSMYLYSFVSPPESLSLFFLGLDLAKPSLLLAILAGIGQFIQTRFFMPGASETTMPGGEKQAELMQSMQRNMAYIFPVMTVFFAMQFPAALALYWVASTVIAILQQLAFRHWFKTTANLPIV